MNLRTFLSEIGVANVFTDVVWVKARDAVDSLMKLNMDFTLGFEGYCRRDCSSAGCSRRKTQMTLPSAVLRKTTDDFVARRVLAFYGNWVLAGET